MLGADGLLRDDRERAQIFGLNSAKATSSRKIMLMGKKYYSKFKKLKLKKSEKVTIYLICVFLHSFQHSRMCIHVICE